VNGRPVSADVVVVGGGLVGSATAYELACAGAEVVLVDASHPGRASDAGAGIVSPETLHDPDEEWFAFATGAADHLRQLVARLGEEGVDAGPDTYAACGSLVLALAEHEDPWFSEVRDVVLRRSPGVSEITAAEARGRFPALAPPWRALYSPAAARLDGRRLSAALRGAADRRGVRLVDTEAVGIERRGDRASSVRTDDGVLACGSVVLAGGAWTAAAGSWLGVALPVAPTKGQIVHVVVPEGRAQPDTGGWPIVQPIFNFYLVPWRGGRVACGGTFEAEAGFDTRPTVAGVRDLLRECAAIAPGLAEATVSEVRVGLRPVSADDRPLLGAVPGWANVHVCSGHGANGLALGPYSGALVAAGVLGGAAPPYGLGRLAG